MYSASFTCPCHGDFPCRAANQLHSAQREALTLHYRPVWQTAASPSQQRQGHRAPRRRLQCAAAIPPALAHAAAANLAGLLIGGGCFLLGLAACVFVISAIPAILVRLSPHVNPVAGCACMPRAHDLPSASRRCAYNYCWAQLQLHMPGVPLRVAPRLGSDLPISWATPVREAGWLHAGLIRTSAARWWSCARCCARWIASCPTRLPRCGCRASS